MDRLWYIKNCRLFERLTAEQLARLERRARVRRFPRKSLVSLPTESAESVFLVGEGRVKLCSTTAEGKEAILDFIEPGELFGELSLVGESTGDEHAETVLDSTIILLAQEELERVMTESPDLTLGVTKLIGWRRRRVERRLKSLLFHSNRERVIHLLLDLAEQYGRQTAEGVLLDIKLSHQDLASIIGATRETVTVQLGELQLEGLLKVGRQRIVIRDLSRLAGCVGSAAPTIPERVSSPSTMMPHASLAPRSKS